MTTTAGRLGDYLRARREGLRPQDVGLVVGATPRRVAGLRREEVAILAGISTDYYLRLEQGRDTHPSPQVLDALARAFRLDAVATAYLRGLVAPPPAEARAEQNDDAVAESTRWLIDSWPNTAAMVHNRYVDVLASNALARTLNPNYRPGVNGVLSLLIDPSEREFHLDWEPLAARSVALLRARADRGAPDHRLDEIVAEGSARSAHFRRFWESHDVAFAGEGEHVVHHPDVGDLTLRFANVPLLDTSGHSIFLYFAKPKTRDWAAMRRLAGVSAGWERQGHARGHGTG